MDDVSVCTPQLAESDAQNNTISAPNAASVTEADKVINTQIDKSPVEGDRSEEKLLAGLLTDDYCHVCEAVLLFESQRLSHYEGKKHAQRVKLYLQAKKAESTATQGLRHRISIDDYRELERTFKLCESESYCNCSWQNPVTQLRNTTHQGGLMSPVSDQGNGGFEEKLSGAKFREKPQGNLVQSDQPFRMLLFKFDSIQQDNDLKHTTKTTPPMIEGPQIQRIITTNKDRFCGLCNMVFGSHLVAKFHYEGKVHAKNLRKQGVQPPVINRFTEVCTPPRSTQDPAGADQASVPEGRAEPLVDPAAAMTTPSTVDLKDPNKCCALCAASFNNPQMALQHYNGRKHQRNQARQDLIKELGDDVQQANFLICQMCSVQFNSVEMYQAHVQGNKHQIKEKKVVDLCKSQQKSYNTYADELADYIQVQKARGITTKTSQVLPQGDTQEDGEGVQDVLNKRNITELKKTMPNIVQHQHQPRPSSYYPPDGGWRPPFQGPAWPPHSWDYSCPPPVLPGSGSPQFTSRPMKRMRRRKQSSSSSYTTTSSHASSSSSSCSSSTSDSDDSEYKRRERRRIRRSEKERGKRTLDEDSDKEERRRKRQRKDRDNEKTTRKREETVESELERRRKKQKKQGKGRRTEKKSQEDDVEREGGDKAMDNAQPEDTMDSRKYTEVHIQAEINVEEGEGGPDESTKPKYRKEKKKLREKLDTRTEEEKLWDDSILGC